MKRRNRIRIVSKWIEKQSKGLKGKSLFKSWGKRWTRHLQSMVELNILQVKIHSNAINTRILHWHIAIEKV